MGYFFRAGLDCWRGSRNARLRVRLDCGGQVGDRGSDGGVGVGNGRAGRRGLRVIDRSHQKWSSLSSSLSMSCQTHKRRTATHASVNANPTSAGLMACRYMLIN